MADDPVDELARRRGWGALDTTVRSFGEKLHEAVVADIGPLQEAAFKAVRDGLRERGWPDNMPLWLMEWPMASLGFATMRIITMAGNMGKLDEVLTYLIESGLAMAADPDALMTTRGLLEVHCECAQPDCPRSDVSLTQVVESLDATLASIYDVISMSIEDESERKRRTVQLTEFLASIALKVTAPVGT